ncbi:MAG: plastocyanin/azurin family copper-binding protein [Actinomycetota bacterium]|nr:plastocyanin/azurin family copper-binding protein [Actinomycetota bacterium]
MLKVIKRSVMLMCIAGLVFAPSALGDSFRVRATAGDQWSPDFRHIAKGDRIVWKNPTSSFHNIVSSSSNWSYDKNLPPGEKRDKRFRRRGYYEYRCTIHPGMNGSIHVGRR